MSACVCGRSAALFFADRRARNVALFLRIAAGAASVLSVCANANILYFQREENMEKKLNEFKPGEGGVVRRIEGEGRIRRRLFDMGVTPGAAVTLRKFAPLGDPVEVNLRGYELSLRKAEAACVVMEVDHA